MTLGPCSYDTSTDRSVLSSMRVVLQDLEAYLWNFPNVLQADPGNSPALQRFIISHHKLSKDHSPAE